MNQDPILILLYPEDFDEHLVKWAQAQIDADLTLAQTLQALQQTQQLLVQSELFQASKPVSLKAEQKILILQAAKQKAKEFQLDQKAISPKAWLHPIFVFSLSILAITIISQWRINDPQHKESLEIVKASKPQSNDQSSINDAIALEKQAKEKLMDSIERQKLALAQQELDQSDRSRLLQDKDQELAKSEKRKRALKNKDHVNLSIDLFEEGAIEAKEAGDKALGQAIAQNKGIGVPKTKALEKPSKKSKAGLAPKQKEEQAKADLTGDSPVSLGKDSTAQAHLGQKNTSRAGVQVGSAQTDVMQASSDISPRPTKALGPEIESAQNQMPMPSAEPVSPRTTTKATQTAARQSGSAVSSAPMIATAEPAPTEEETEAPSEDAQMIAQGMSQSQGIPRVTPMNIDQKPAPMDDAGLNTLDEARRLLKNGKPNQALEQYMLWINQAPASPKKRQAIQEAKALAQQLNRNDLLKKLRALEEESLNPPKEADETRKSKAMKLDSIDGY
jgi:hypothetical protein